MKISLNWISDFVKMDSAELSARDPQKLAQKIAEHCFEVEKIIHAGASGRHAFSKVFVAKVLEWKKHPNADRLRIVKLDLGKRVIEPVVCGANNFDVGDFVALALPGAKIPQNVHTGEKAAFVLEKVNIRGVESQGMVCSAFELGLAEMPETNPEILLIDKKSALVGQPLEEHLGGASKQASADDIVLDLALPANRPDLHSHWGIAREFAGILGAKPTTAFTALENKYGKNPQTKSGKNALSIQIKNTNLCSYYFGAKIKVKVGPSPKFIKDRLQAVGLRSINNVVDITNYVMYEMGQPLHAFDARVVSGKIVIRNSAAGERMISLDHKQRVLTPHMLVIADQEKPLAIAGVIGGEHSEISSTTEEIILESANFEPTQIRRTSKALNLRTDASGLWEKGLQPRQAVLGANRALELLKQYAGAEIISTSVAGKIKDQKRSIKFTADKINNILGTEFKLAYIKKMLARVGIKVSGAGTARIPYYRADMENYADLADEIARISGMNNIERKPLAMPRGASISDHSKRIYAVKDKLARFGLNEVQNYSFVSGADIKRFVPADPAAFIKVTNPLSVDQQYMNRYPLIPVLKNINHNAKYFENIELFEISKTYLGFGNEPEVLLVALYDKNSSAELLLAKIKGMVDALFAQYSSKQLLAEERAENVLSLSLDDTELGHVGMVPPQVLLNFDIDRPVAFAKLSLEKIWQFQEKKVYKPYSKFPNKVLDISVVVPKDVFWQDILEVVTDQAGKNLQSVELFEAPYFYPPNHMPKYQRDFAEKGLKNLAFHMVFQAENSTLKDSEILPIYAKIQEGLQAKLKAEIR